MFCPIPTVLVLWMPNYLYQQYIHAMKAKLQYWFPKNVNVLISQWWSFSDFYSRSSNLKMSFFFINACIFWCCIQVCLKNCSSSGCILLVYEIFVIFCEFYFMPAPYKPTTHFIRRIRKSHKKFSPKAGFARRSFPDRNYPLDTLIPELKKKFVRSI